MNMIFSNKDLQSIHLTAEGSIASHLTKLDEVSSDIKALEAILQKSGISLNFKYVFEEVFEKGSLRVSEFDFVDTRVEIQHCIIWDRDKQRLMYEVHETENEIVDPPETSYKTWGPCIRISKPVIEAKAHVRLKILPELQYFYREIVKLLGKGQVDEEVTVLSSSLIPF